MTGEESSSGTFYSTYYTKCVADWLLLLDFRGCTLFYAPKYMIAKETSFLNCLRMLRAYTVFSFWHNEIRIYQGIYAKWHTCSIWYGLMPTTIEYVLYKKRAFATMYCFTSNPDRWCIILNFTHNVTLVYKASVSLWNNSFINKILYIFHCMGSNWLTRSITVPWNDDVVKCYWFCWLTFIRTFPQC